MIKVVSIEDANAVNCATINPLKSIYFVGTFAERINFASQQRRAIRLVHALAKETLISPASKIAVIGGGIAGVTAASAAISLGCEVDIYETGGSFCNLQANTTRRWIHPTVNFWPLEPLSHVTEFPFLNWHAAPCDEVIKLISQNWKTYAYPSCRPFLRTTVTSVRNSTGPTAANSHGKIVEISAKNSSGDEFKNYYDAAILCIGFGQERTTALSSGRLRSYWVDVGWDVTAFSDDRPMWISGAGDGALFEALDVVYSGFGKGRLISEFATEIEHLRLHLVDVELHARSLDSESAADYIFRNYNDIISRPDVGRFLDQHLAPPHQKVVLLHKSQHIISVRTAPLHRLLIVFGMARNRISAVRGALDESAAIPTYIPQPAGTATVIDRAVDVVARHGADKAAALAALLTPEIVESLLKDPIRCSQSALLDMPWRHDGYAFFEQMARYQRIFPCQSGNVDEWHQQVVSLVRGALHSYGVRTFGIGCKRLRGKSGPWVIDVDVPGDGHHTRLGDSLSEVFGMKITWNVGSRPRVQLHSSELVGAA